MLKFGRIFRQRNPLNRSFNSPAQPWRRAISKDSLRHAFHVLTNPRGFLSCRCELWHPPMRKARWISPVLRRSWERSKRSPCMPELSSAWAILFSLAFA